MRELLLYCAIPVFVLLTLKRPFVGIIVYAGMNIIRPEMFFWGGNTGSILFRIFFISTSVSFIINNRDELLKPASRRELWFLLWMYIALIISIYFSPYSPHPQVFTYANEILKLSIFGWIVVGVLKKKKDVFNYELWVLGLGSFLALWGIDQYFRGNVRLEGISGTDSNEFAAMMVLLAPLAFNLALNGGTLKKKILGLGASIAFVMAIIFTMSRGGFLGLCVVVGMFVLRTKKRWKILLILSLIAVSVSFFVTDQITSRLSTITTDEEQQDFSSGSRLVLWRAGLLIFLDNPILGTGFLSFPKAKLPYKYQIDGVDEELLEYSFLPYKVGHNTYVKLLSEGGLLLFTPYLLLLLNCFACNLHIRRLYGSVEREEDSLNLLFGIESGIIGCAFCFIFIDAVTSILLPLQIIVAGSLRGVITFSVGELESPR